MCYNVIEWLEDVAERYPDKVAYEDPDESMTFGEVLVEARRIGSAITEKVVSPKPIAVMMGRGVHTIATFLGIACSGHAYAPMDSNQPEARIRKIFELLQPDVVIMDNDGEVLTGNAGVIQYKDIRDHAILDDKLYNARHRMTDASPLYIIFTSGSSGTPKGVITSHHSLMCYISSYVKMMGIDASDRMCAQSPLDYIAAVRDIYVPLLTGAYDYLCPKEYFMQPEQLLSLLNEKHISCIGWSTSALGVLTKLGALKDGAKPESLKKICFSGSVMPGKVLREWQEALPSATFINQYGPTEVTASCTYYKVEHLVDVEEVIPIGKPYENYKVFLMDDDGSEVETGDYGEICVSGSGLALGYYNDRERTNASFTQNPLNHSYNELIYRTGDIGRYNEDGNLEFHGRKDRQIKHMGHRVELDEIEVAAMQQAGVGEAAALYDTDKEAIWLFYTGDLDTRTLVLGLRETLPGFMVPRKVKQLENLPHLANGKVDMEILKREI